MEKLDLAAKTWPDPLIRDFLMGVVAYHRDDYTQADGFFRKCVDAEPFIAAFHQGRGLVLLGNDHPLWAIEELLAALSLWPDSRDLLGDIQQAMKKVPGTSIKDPIYLQAQKILALYTDLPTRTYSTGGVSWLMPGREWSQRGESLPTPPYDRLAFRQGAAVPIAKNSLLVDAAVLKDSLEVFVRIDANTVAPAYARRTGAYGRGAPPLAILTVPGYEFDVPGTLEEGNRVAAEGTVSAVAVPFYAEMGSLSRRVTGKAGGAATDGSVIVSATLSPGESASPVFAADGTLIGFLAAKIDIAQEGGGPDRLIPVSQLSTLLKQTRAAAPDHSTYGRVKRTPSPRAAPGETFLVTAICGETLD